MDALSAVLIAAGLVGNAMVSGFFWGWSVSAMLGLRRVDDRTYVTSMRSINRAILNPIFLVVFAGTLVALVAASVTTFIAGDSRRGVWITASMVAYAVGVFGVTAAGNVPLNDRLEAFDPTGADDDAHQRARVAYEGPWNRLHVIRSVIGVLSVTMGVVAALSPTQD